MTLTAGTPTFRRQFNFTLDHMTYAGMLLGGDDVGSTSFVYLAYLWDSEGDRPQGEPLILKRFEPSERMPFETERGVLERVRAFDGKAGEQHFPRLIGSAEQYFSDQLSYLLLMEYAGTTSVDRNVPLAERDALLLLAHYLSCLVTLGRAGYSCWDRKLKDFFWTPPDRLDYPSGRLVVIDWNMAESWSPGRMVQDLIVAGRLFYELLTGSTALKRSGSEYFDLENSASVQQTESGSPNSSSWQRISYGTQVITQQLLEGGRKLLSDLEATHLIEEAANSWMLDRVREIQVHCLEIAEQWTRDVRALMDEVEWLVSKQDWVAALERSSIALLTETPNTTGWQEGRLSLQKYQEAHDRSKSAVLQSHDYLQPLRTFLTQGSLFDADHYISDLLAAGRNLSLAQELDITRWQFVIRKTMSAAAKDQSHQRTAAMRTIKLFQAMSDFEGALKRCEFQTAKLAIVSLADEGQPLRYEVDIRELMNNAEESFVAGDLSDAYQKYQASLRLLTEVSATQDPDVLRFWQLVRESLGELEKKVQETARLVSEREVPDKALGRAVQSMKNHQFRDAVKQLDDALALAPVRNDLASQRQIAQKLLYLQQMWAAAEPDKELKMAALPVLVSYACELCSELPTEWSSYPRDVLKRILDACDLTWARLTSPTYPGSLSDIGSLLKSARALPAVITALREEGGLPTNMTKPLLDPSLVGPELERLERHVTLVEALDHIVGTRGSALDDLERRTLLQSAAKLGLNTLSTGEAIGAELNKINRKLELAEMEGASGQLQALVARVRRQLTTKAGYEARRILERSIAEAKELITSARGKEAEALYHWLKAARDLLPDQLEEIAAALKEYKEVFQTSEVWMAPLMQQLDARITSARVLLDELRETWPAGMGAAPLLGKLADNTDVISAQLWHERSRTLISRLPVLPIPSQLPLLLTAERLLLSLEECKRQSESTWPVDYDRRIQDYTAGLRGGWQRYFEEHNIATAVPINTAVRQVIMARAAEFQRSNDILPALWLSAVAKLIGASSDDASEIAPQSEQDPLLASLPGSGFDNNALAMQLFQQVESTPEYRNQFRQRLKEYRSDVLNSLLTPEGDELLRQTNVIRELEDDNAKALAMMAQRLDILYEIQVMRSGGADSVLEELNALAARSDLLSEHQAYSLWVRLVLLPLEFLVDSSTLHTLEERVKRLGIEDSKNGSGSLIVPYRMLIALIRWRVSAWAIFNSEEELP